MTQPAVVLSIGGSDSGGCYGVQADMRCVAAMRAHAACALTVVTAQHTLGVQAALPVPVELVAAQIDAVLADFDVGAVKTGMLGRVEVVELVAARAAAGRLPNLVVDPVLVDRHGRQLFGEDLVEAYRSTLVPLAGLVTPNTLEAALLCAAPAPAAGSGNENGSGLDVEAMRRIAAALGAPVVITGGRARDSDGNRLDVLWDGAALHELSGPDVPTTNNAGSGDAFSAAIATLLAQGAPTLLDAVLRAKHVVHDALAGAVGWRLGAGPGPLDVFGWSSPLPRVAPAS